MGKVKQAPHTQTADGGEGVEYQDQHCRPHPVSGQEVAHSEFVLDWYDCDMKKGEVILEYISVGERK